MSKNSVGECESCGVKTRGELCMRCKDRSKDAAKAFVESVAQAIDNQSEETRTN